MLWVGFVIAISIPPVSSLSAHKGLRIVDDQNRPVSGATVRVWMPPSGPQDLAGRLVPLCEAKSSDNGIAACSAPRLAGGLITIDAPHFEPLLQALDGTALDHVVLRPGSSLGGHIVSPRLRPEQIAQARVRATAVIEMPERKQTFRFDREGVVADNGDFTITGLPSSVVSVRLELPGFLPWIADQGPGNALRASLKPGILLSGRVIDEKEHPIKGAQLAQADNPSGASSQTDDAGRFEIAIRALPASLDVVASGYRKERIDVSKEKKAEDLVIRLHPGQGVTGEVYLSDGAPLDRVTVWTETKSAPGQTRSPSKDVTVDHGAFRIDLPAAGVYSFRFDAAAHEPEWIRDIRVPSGTYVDLRRVSIGQGAGATGTVTDARTGDPVPGATVELQSVSTSLLRDLRYRKAIRALTADHGEFAVSGASAGSYVLRIQASPYPSWFRSVSLADGEIVQLGQIALGQDTEVSGAVVNRAGNPQTGVQLRFFDDAGASAMPLQETTSDAGGRFSGVHLSPGRYIVRAFSDRLLLSQPFQVGEDERERTLDLEIPAVRLTGVVRRAGTPATGGTLSLVEQLDPAERQGKIILQGSGVASGTFLSLGTPSSMLVLGVGPSGEFASDRVAPGLMTATYRADDGRTWERQLNIPDVAEYQAEIALDGANIEGIVVGEDGTPIGDVQLTLVLEGGERVGSVGSTQTGTFEFNDLQTGNYTILTRAAGYRARAVSGIHVMEGSSSPPQRVVLAPGNSGTLTVQLTRGDGSAADYVAVTLLDPTGAMIRSLPTDSSGIRQFEDLPPGQYIAAWADAYCGVGASEPITVDGQTAATYSRTLTPGARLEVTCTSPECSAKPLSLLNVLSASGVDIAAYLSGVSVGLRFSSDSGRLTLGTLSPGAYSMRIGVGGAVYEHTLRAASGGDLVISVP
jgi:Carboxypeptidase regulatory-like domain